MGVVFKVKSVIDINRNKKKKSSSLFSFSATQLMSWIVGLFLYLILSILHLLTSIKYVLQYFDLKLFYRIFFSKTTWIWTKLKWTVFGCEWLVKKNGNIIQPRTLGRWNIYRKVEKQKNKRISVNVLIMH